MKFLYITLFIFLVVSVDGQKNDAEYLSLKKEYTINNDGTYKVHYQHNLKYNSYISFNRLFGETFIHYNPDFQKLMINKCYTTKPDGKIIYAPKNAFNEILPSFAAYSGTYNNIREMVVTHTGLERGVVVTLDYCLISKVNKIGFISGTEHTIFKVPCKNLTYIFRTPKNYPLTFSGNKGVFSQKIVNDSIVYTFSYSNVLAQSQLPFAANTLSVLHFNNGNVFNKQLATLLADLGVVSADFNMTSLQKVKDIYDRFIHKVRLIKIPIKFQKIPVPSSSQVLSENSGSLMELAKAFIDELNKENIKSQLVFSVPKYKFDDDSTSIYDINDVFVKVLTSDVGSFLFPMNKSEKNNLNKTDLSKIYIVWANNKWTLLENNEVNTVNAVCDVNILNLKYDLKFDCSGVFSELNKPEFSNLDNSKDSQKGDKYINSGNLNVEVFGEFNTVSLPVLLNGILDVVYQQLPQNEFYDIELNDLVKQNFIYNVKFSKDISLVRLPKDTLIYNKYFSISSKVVNKNGYVKISQNVELKSLIIPKEFYNKFRDMLAYVLDENNFKIVFAKK